jgi:hypothetical protein
MAAFVYLFFEERVEQLFDLAALVEKVFTDAGLEYRIAGGLAAYLYVEDAEPDAGRLTAGIDMLVREGQPSARRAVHLVFAGEKVRPEYCEPAPALGPCQVLRGLRVVPLADLVRMKLTSFRLKDQVHLQDLDAAGLITPETEAGLPPALAERLAEVRTRE